MSINTNLEEYIDYKPKRIYPYLAQYRGDGVVVLFTKLDHGIVVHDPEDCYHVGHLLNGYDEQSFDPLPYYTKITLQNKPE